MSNIFNDIIVVLGSLRYKSAPNTDIGLKVPFIQSTKNGIEFDRSANVSLAQVFDDERQKSTIFRPVAKFSLIFPNSYTGLTDYSPFANSLYYTNSEYAARQECEGNPVTWGGFPQYNEFDFIRTDYNLYGYTISDVNVAIPPTGSVPPYHLLFRQKDASFYNWSFCMTYASENDVNQEIQAQVSVPLLGVFTLTWKVSDGVPFIVKLKKLRGMNVIQFWCGTKHNLSVGEYIKFNAPYNFDNIDIFQVYSLGDDRVGSDEYVFNILNPGFATVTDGDSSTFKRVVINSNLNETTSEYYVRRHKVLTEPNTTVLVNAGYEQNIFKDKSKFERAPYTPNEISRISYRETGQAYTLSFGADIDINNLVDNQTRPLSKLYYTVIWRGYFGWTKSLKQGWENNLQLTNSILGTSPQSWWSSTDADTGLSTSTYTNAGYTFTYTNQPTAGTLIDGDICEWNDYEQMEKELSLYYHKIRFEANNFNISMGSADNPYGYFYQPHHEVDIAVFSDYIEEGSAKNTVGVPDWAYYSENRDVFVWRDKYPYGYIDTNNYGVNWPFMNGRHHPYKNIIFRIIPEGTNYKEYTRTDATTQTMIIDGCE